MLVHICVQSQFNTESSGSVSRPHLGFIQLIVFLHYLVAFYRQLCNPVLWRNSVTFLIAMHILIWRKTHFHCHLCFSYEAEMEVFAPSFLLSTAHPSPHHPSAYQNICASAVPLSLFWTVSRSTFQYHGMLVHVVHTRLMTAELLWLVLQHGSNHIVDVLLFWWSFF